MNLKFSIAYSHNLWNLTEFMVQNFHCISLMIIRCKLPLLQLSPPVFPVLQSKLMPSTILTLTQGPMKAELTHSLSISVAELSVLAEIQVLSAMHAAVLLKYANPSSSLPLTVTIENKGGVPLSPLWAVLNCWVVLAQKSFLLAKSRVGVSLSLEAIQLFEQSLLKTYFESNFCAFVGILKFFLSFHFSAPSIFFSLLLPWNFCALFPHLENKNEIWLGLHFKSILFLDLRYTFFTEKHPHLSLVLICDELIMKLN